MSRTRTAKKGSPLRQERWASSPAFGEVIRGGLVARRCQTLADPADIEIAWFIQELSLRSTHEFHPTCVSFPAWPWPTDGKPEKPLARAAREICQNFEVPGWNANCIEAALTRFCLDPSYHLSAQQGGPVLMAAIQAYKHSVESNPGRPVANTEIQGMVFEALDYCMHQSGIVVIEGTYRSGKTFAAQAWVLQNIGKARYVSLGSAPDDASFYRDIARSLGVAHGRALKAPDIRMQCERVLRSQSLALVLDEAQYLWSQCDRPRSAPERVNWIMTAASNYGVPIALITGRNFYRAQEATQRSCAVWGSEQLHGRIRLRKKLPDALEPPDLMAICKTLLPEADEPTRMLLSGQAMRSRGYLGSLESIASRAKYFADRKLAAVSFEDVEAAIREASGDQETPPRANRQPPQASFNRSDLWEASPTPL